MAVKSHLEFTVFKLIKKKHVCFLKELLNLQKYAKAFQ